MMRKGKLSFILLFLILCYWPNLAQSQTVLFPPDSIQSIPDLVLEQRGDKADVFFPKASLVSENYRDNFDTRRALDGSNGSIDWSESPWVKDDSDITVEFDSDSGFNSVHIEFDGDADFGSSIYREADLDGAESAILSFDQNSDSDGQVVLEVSGNGGSTWTTLKTYNLGSTPAGHDSFDISSHSGSKTRIRFRLTDRDDGHLYIDNVDIAFQIPSTPAGGSAGEGFPVVAILQGAGVDKSFYAEFGLQLARYGFVVVIPNHFQIPFFPPGAPPSPLPDQYVVLDVQAQMELEDADPASSLFGIVDTGRLGLVGHSFGGATGLFVIDGRCDGPPFCDEATFGSFERPETLVAGAFYGTNTCSAGGTVKDARCTDFNSFPPNTGLLLDVATNDYPVALVQGSVDGISTPAEGQATFDILDGVRTFTYIKGANHYGITDVNNPGAVFPNFIPPTPDPNPPIIPQAEAVQQVAQAMGRFLRTHVGIGLSVSSSENRSGTIPLEGATLSGDAFIFLIPLFPDGDIDQVDFFLDGSFVKTESFAPYDLKGTRAGGVPAPFDTRKLDDGFHTVRAEIVFPSGVQPVASTFTTLNNEFSLSVSFSADRSGTIPLEGATLSGNAYIFLIPLFPDADIDQVDFFLDGSFVKTESFAPYDLKGTRAGGVPAPFDTRTLDDGSHSVRAEIMFDSGEVEAVANTFSVSNDSDGGDDD